MSRPASLVVFLARSGVGSRRACDDLVRSGAVAVNGEVVDFPRYKLAATDAVTVSAPVTWIVPLRMHELFT